MLKALLSTHVPSGCAAYHTSNIMIRYGLSDTFGSISNRTKTLFKTLLLLVVICLTPFLSFSQINFSASFANNTIGPGSVSKLVFTIDNSGGAAVSSLSFTNTLPAELTVATPSIAKTSALNGSVTASDGGSAISYSLDRMAAGDIVTVEVYVTGTTPGTYTNTSGDLTYNGGDNAGTASADLTIAADRPGFTKSFSPTTINLGERSTLTFTIDNSANASGIATLAFTDNLPQGMVIASPANTSTTCGNNVSSATLTADSGSDAISFFSDGSLPSSPSVAAGATCSISVDVIGQISGQLNNLTSELQASSINGGKASALLEVRTPSSILLQKKFVANTVAPGGSTDVEYTITNFDRSNAATNVTFTDDLNAALSGLAATGTPLSDVCGAGSQLTGTTVLTFTGGNIPAGGSCTFSVPVQIPSGATLGNYTSTSGAISADLGGGPVTGNTATDKLFIANTPTFTKTFLTDLITAGDTTTVQCIITNTSTTSALTGITFGSGLDNFINGATVAAFPAANSCGAGSQFSTADVLQFQMTGGNIAAGQSCTFTVDIKVPTNQSPGTYTYATNNLSGTVDGNSVAGISASDDLTVLAVPRISKSFTNAPVNAGGIVNLEYTITYDEFATGDATNISFTDDLNAVILGFSATGLPLTDICGTGASISGTSTITFTGGTLSPGGTCTFIVPVQVPSGIVPGTFTSTSSNLTATVGGQSATGSQASDDLIIGGLNFTKEFIGDPVLPGGLVTLRFTIENTTTLDATDVFFTDNLGSALSGLAAEAPLPTGAAICNGSLSGTTFLVYTGGTILSGTTCTFDVPVRVPANAVSDTYRSTTSNLTATIDGSTRGLSPATDELTVNNNLISLSKTFTDDPVVPGGTVIVEYTLTNLDPNNQIDNVAFTDDFNAALTGLTATGLPMNDICGTGASISGTTTLTLTGGSLAPGGTCTFSVTLQTPGSTPFGTVVTSTTSSLTGDIGGVAVVGDPASDNLVFQSIQFSKSFAGPVEAGGTVALAYTLTNSSSSNILSDISFTDDLNAFISGAVAVNLPLTNTCGVGSGVSGTSVINFGRGELDPGQTCTFTVQVKIPCTTIATIYTSASGSILVSGIGTGTASADLKVTTPAGATFTAPADLCLNAGVQTGLGGGLPSGGVYSGIGVINDGNGTTFLFNPVTATVGGTTIKYTRQNANGCTVEATDDIEVLALPIITTQPQNSSICQGNNGSFSVQITGAIATYQWQELISGTYQNITDGGIYGGVTTATLSLSFPDEAKSGSKYRVVISRTGCEVISSVATLSITLGAEALTIINVSPISGIYFQQAVSFVVALNRIEYTANVTYQAGNNITLLPGFETESGSVFRAQIQNSCSNTPSGTQNASNLPKELTK
ncbi:MAG: hypothetical protein ACI964_001806 [Spirosomataceae bacterium]|jgi:hypothetical protein